ncbi:SDR family oxidoreductase [Sphingomonas sp. BGYR3]|uniref:SDR family oxidoreductase n=1 Tax=Sphingomonas sp. BGYR3 TaxID=2975483 RepID=UPI0021A75601|nr:SDR family oxidoreductase [Sphingomonas sp. BGYR3]MDG5489065.1 SDR family oxidoreductase [Sphingomonas sp. BGYR3]
MIRQKPLNQQVMVITGASSGIGLATARMASSAGAKVLLVARNDDALAQAVADIRQAGGTADHLAVDVADADAAQRISAKALASLGPIDTWVNNAAVALFARLDQTTLDEQRRVFDVGYFATVAASLHAVEQMKATGGGTLINVGSVLSERAAPLQGAYSAMKHAVLGFTEALRSELQQEGAPIQVTLIKPHGIDTPYPEHARNRLGKPAQIPPPLYSADLVAKAICFAAANPRRELLVGGAGMSATIVGNLVPGLSDWPIAKLFGRWNQTTDQPPEPGTSDNLFEPRSDGRVASNQRRFVRQSSLALAAQLHPARIAGGALVAGGLAYWMLRGRMHRTGD